MNKFILMGLGLLLIAGCGNNQQVKQETTANSSQEYIQEGMNYLAEQEIVKAIQSFDAAIKNDPKNVDNYLVLGQVYMRMKQYERAIDTFSAAIRVAPNHGDAYYLLATNKALDGRKDSALLDAQRSAELFMQNREEAKFKKAVALVHSLKPSEDASAAGSTTQ